MTDFFQMYAFSCLCAMIEKCRPQDYNMVSLVCTGHTGVGTDHDKLLAQLETDLKESQQLVRVQQQLLQV